MPRKQTAPHARRSRSEKRREFASPGGKKSRQETVAHKRHARHARSTRPPSVSLSGKGTAIITEHGSDGTVQMDRWVALADQVLKMPPDSQGSKQS